MNNDLITFSPPRPTNIYCIVCEDIPNEEMMPNKLKIKCEELRVAYEVPTPEQEILARVLIKKINKSIDLGIEGNLRVIEEVEKEHEDFFGMYFPTIGDKIRENKWKLQLFIQKTNREVDNLSTMSQINDAWISKGRNLINNPYVLEKYPEFYIRILQEIITQTKNSMTKIKEHHERTTRSTATRN